MKLVPLKIRNQVVEHTMVDDEDCDKLAGFYLSMEKRRHGTTDYARITVGQKSIQLHRYLMALHGHNIDGLEIDHEDRNGLNNQKNNLRICTHAQNNANKIKYRRNCTSKYKGVSQKGSRWVVRMMIDNKTKCVGTFDSELDAAIAYDLFAAKHFGQFAVFNFTNTSQFNRDRVITLLENPKKNNKSPSKYRCVSKDKTRWYFCVRNNGKTVRFYGFRTDLEAAIARDVYIKEYGLNCVLSLETINIYDRKASR